MVGGASVLMEFWCDYRFEKVTLPGTSTHIQKCSIFRHDLQPQTGGLPGQPLQRFPLGTEENTQLGFTAPADVLENQFGTNACALSIERYVSFIHVYIRVCVDSFRYMLIDTHRKSRDC